MQQKSQSASRRKPYRYIDIIPNRHGGGVFVYFRRNGNRTPLPATVGSAEFLAAYAACINGNKPAAPTPVARIKAGTVQAMIDAYTASAEFRDIVKQDDRMRAFQYITGPMDLGDVMVSSITGMQVKGIVDNLAAAKPGIARFVLTAFNIIFKQAQLAGFIQGNPAHGIVDRPKLSVEGRHSWSEAEIAQYRAHHALGTMARLALEIFLNTAARCCDAWKFGPGTGTVLDVGGVKKLRFVQQKIVRKVGTARATVTMGIHPALQAALDAMTVVGAKTWLVTVTGKSFDAGSLSKQFAAWCNEVPELPAECGAHGLRKACAKRLIEAGVSVPDAAAITGQHDVKVLMDYAAAWDRSIGADRAIRAIS